MTAHRRPDDRTSRQLSAALRYSALGWRVLPLHTPTHDGTCSCQSPDCPSPGKHPRLRRAAHAASHHPAVITAWWRRWPAANVGIATGRLLVVDLDGVTGHATLAALERQHAPLPATLTALTGRGSHRYFDAGDQQLRNSTGSLGPGLDVRAHGGYVVAPPSRHADGQRYRWQTTHPPAVLPAWLARLLAAPRPRATAEISPAPTTSPDRYLAAVLTAELADVATAAVGTRNDTLNRAAFRVAQLLADGPAELDTTHDALLDAALRAGLGEAEAHATISSGLRAGLRHPRTPAAS